MDSPKIPLIDIAVNLTDPMFTGVYNGKQCHQSDILSVLSRAFDGGVRRIIITGGSLQDSEEALKLSGLSDKLYCTVGVHPTRCNEFERSPEEHLQKLLALIQKNAGKVEEEQRDPSVPQGQSEKVEEERRDPSVPQGQSEKVVAIGEFGLDYDRVQFCPVETQKKYFEFQFRLAEASKLPLFLHMRSSAPDFIEIIKRNRHRFSTGVVHSFTGSADEARQLIDLDLYIGINGCSLKTPEDLEMVRSIPSNRLMLETDAPWCDLRQSHAGWQHVKTKWALKDKSKFRMGECVKGRNEPAMVIQVLEVVAAIKKEDPSTLANQVFQNTMSVFFPNELEAK